MNRKGLSLLEVLVSLVLLALVVTGLFNTFISGKKFILHSRARIAASEMGKMLLDYMQMHVRTDTWDNVSSNALTLGDYYCDNVGGHTQIAGCLDTTNRTLNNDLTGSTTGDIIYNATYNITPFNNLRRVILRINWNETAVY